VSVTCKSTAAAPPTHIDDLAATLEAVRSNCHIVDAQYATDYTLCVYLLKMREYYRWEHNLPFGARLPHKALTDWLSQRETRWEALQDNDFHPVPVMDTHHDPFEAETINHALNKHGYVYSSGYGHSMKPMFFLGELESRQQYNGYTLVVSGREHARDLASPPAMSQGKTIFVRRESLRRMLWEKIEEWNWNKPANAMQNALGCYDFEGDAEASLDAMTDNEVQSVILHEIGEVMAGERLGDEWEAMLSGLPHSKAEIMVRAVRDHLADALSTLPGLLQRDNAASLHFYMGNMANMRKQLFPGLVAAYDIWTATGDTREIERLLAQSETHWLTLAGQMLDIHRSQGSDCQAALVELVEANTL